MNAYLHPEAARALLAQSRAWTEAKRLEKAEARALEEAMRMFARFGWTGNHAEEMAAAHLRVSR